MSFQLYYIRNLFRAPDFDSREVTKSSNQSRRPAGGVWLQWAAAAGSRQAEFCAKKRNVVLCDNFCRTLVKATATILNIYI